MTETEENAKLAEQESPSNTVPKEEVSRERSPGGGGDDVGDDRDMGSRSRSRSPDDDRRTKNERRRRRSPSASQSRSRSRRRSRSGSSPERRSRNSGRRRDRDRSPQNRRREHSDGGKKIFVGYMDPHCDEIDLEDCFKKYGPIEDIFVPRDEANRCNRGFGFVTFADKRDALDACAEDGRELCGRRIGVNLAKVRRTQGNGPPKTYVPSKDGEGGAMRAWLGSSWRPWYRRLGYRTSRSASRSGRKKRRRDRSYSRSKSRSRSRDRKSKRRRRSPSVSRSRSRSMS